jgi:large subunit ribosomal protein L25
MKNTVTFEAAPRSATGKGAARALRREGRIPAIIYGGKQEVVMISLPEREITHRYRRPHFKSQIMQLQVGDTSYQVLPQDIELHPVSDAIEHIDFRFVSDKEMIHVKVKLHCINTEKCAGIKMGGVLNIVHREIEVICPANAIPQQIDVDISQLALGHSIHLRDIVLPANVTASSKELEQTLVTIVGRTEEKEEAAPEAEAAAPAAETKA